MSLDFLTSPFTIGILIKCGFTMVVFYAILVLMTPNERLQKTLPVVKKIGAAGLIFLLTAFLLLVWTESDSVLRLIRNLFK